VGIMIANAIMIAYYEYFIVNDLRQRYAAKRRTNMQLLTSGVDQNSEV
jgi:hypothetical protein